VQFYVAAQSIKDHSGYLEPIFDFLGFYLLTSAFDFSSRTLIMRPKKCSHKGE
jgi:hypothetical protein